MDFFSVSGQVALSLKFSGAGFAGQQFLRLYRVIFVIPGLSFDVDVTAGLGVTFVQACLGQGDVLPGGFPIIVLFTLDQWVFTKVIRVKLGNREIDAQTFCQFLQAGVQVVQAINILWGLRNDKFNQGVEASS